MPLPIISADERSAERRGFKLVLLGRSGIGKTSQLRMLDPATTLFVNIEAGNLAVLDWPGDTLRAQTWTEFRDLAVFLAGPNAALPPEQPFSATHYEHVCRT